MVWLVAGIVGCGPSPKARDDAATIDDVPCALRCSDDLTSTVDCHDTVTPCDAVSVCDPARNACTNACAVAETNKRSIGCDYYATSMDIFTHGGCFAAFVANTWPAAAHIEVKHRGTSLPVASFVRIPIGSGPSVTYGAYDPVAGLAPGQVAVLFLGGQPGGFSPCPIPSAVPVSSFAGTGIGDSFEIVTDVPVVAYQINPYGGGVAGFTGASLLLPTSVWDVNYVAVNAAPQSSNSPSLNIIARDDGTIATITPNAAIVGGTGIPAGPAGAPINIVLAKGQHAQITQVAELTGSIVTANKPIGFRAGHACFNLPVGTNFCDHAEQMLPPVRAVDRSRCDGNAPAASCRWRPPARRVRRTDAPSCRNCRRPLRARSVHRRCGRRTTAASLFRHESMGP